MWPPAAAPEHAACLLEGAAREGDDRQWKQPRRFTVPCHLCQDRRAAAVDVAALVWEREDEAARAWGKLVAAGEAVRVLGTVDKGVTRHLTGGVAGAVQGYADLAAPLEGNWAAMRVRMWRWRSLQG